MPPLLRYYEFMNSNTKHWSGDIWGGLAAMLVALPSAIAFGVTIFSPLGADFAAKGALAGMLGVAALGLIAASLGGTERLISAPCAPAAAVLSALTIQMVQANSDAPSILLTLLLVSLCSALAQIGMGVLRIGELIKFMPFPVVSGYLSGVGFVIVLSQLPKWLALPKGMGLFAGLVSPTQWQSPSLLIGAATAAVMVLGPRISRQVPAVIQGLLAGFGVYWLLAYTAWPELQHLQGNPFIIGSLEISDQGMVQELQDSWGQFMASHWPSFEQVLYPALTLAVLLSIDTLKTCVVLDALTGSRHNSNKELIGQGLGNLSSALIGGIPGAGTMGATLVNKASGGTTHWSGVFQGAWSLLAIVLLTPVIAWVPVAALAALLVVVGIRMVDWHSVRFLQSKDTVLDFAIIASVAVVANTVSLIAASGFGVALSVVLFMNEQIHTDTIRRKMYGNQLFSTRARGQQERRLLQDMGGHTVVFELQGSLFFGTTDQLFCAIEKEIPNLQFLVLDFLRVQSIDMTAGHMIERIRNMLADQNARLILTRVPEHLPSGRDLRTYVDHIGLLSDRTAKIFNELDEALEWIEEETLKMAGQAHVSKQGLSLRDFEIFHGLNEHELQALERCASYRTYAQEELVFGADTPGHELMLISRGEVRVSLPASSGKTIHLSTFSRGQFFGEMSFLDARPHSADVRASHETEVIVIDRKAFAHVAGQDPVLSINVMRSVALAIADRLRHANADLREMREA
jgi:SulP family sulfate permease